MQRLPGALPAHARFQVALPIAGALVGFLGFLMMTTKRYSTVGQLMVATGSLVGGIASAAILYNQLHAQQAARLQAPT